MSENTLPIDSDIRDMNIQNVDKLVATKLQELVVSSEAKRIYDQLISGQEFRDFEFANLDEFYELEDSKVSFRVGDDSSIVSDTGLWAKNTTVLLAAQAKAGKTTLMLNLMHALVTGQKFLGKYHVQELNEDERLGVLNLEVSDGQYKKWMKSRNIPSSAKVAVANLRGKAGSVNPLNSESRNEFAKKLRVVGITCLIIDPVGPILRANGIDENDTTGVGRLLDAINSLREDTPVRDIMIVHHGGHNVLTQDSRPGLSRGASTWNDVPDSLWSYYKPDKETHRLFRAGGRDVDLEPTVVTYESETRTLTAAGIPTVSKNADGSTKISLNNKPSINNRRRGV